MKEVDLNRIVANSLDWSYKIPDPPQVVATIASQRPFDGFGSWRTLPVYWEGKFSKQLKSFDLSRIADHQAAALSAIHTTISTAHIWIVYGVYVGRADFRVWVFDWSYIQPRRLAKQNILKKELEQLPFFVVKKQAIELDWDMIIGDEQCKELISSVTDVMSPSK
jgi:hypothetical protein